MKEYSKSDKHSTPFPFPSLLAFSVVRLVWLTTVTVWEAAAEAEEKRREQARHAQRAERHAIVDEINKQKKDMEYSISDPAQRSAEDPITRAKSKGVSILRVLVAVQGCR